MRKAFISACSSGLARWAFSASDRIAPLGATTSAANGWLPSSRERRARPSTRRNSASSLASGKSGLAQHAGGCGIVALDEGAELQAGDRALLHDHASVDHREPGARRRAREQPGDDVAMRARMFNAVDPKCHQVRGLTRFERADVVAPEERCAAQRGELERLARRHAIRPRLEPGPADALKQHRLARLAEHVVAVVARGSVDAEPYP